MNIEEAERRALWKEAFGDTDEFLDSFFSTAFSQKRCRCLTRGGHLAAALYWFDCEYAGEKLAYLYAVATAARFQGQGLCHALMEDTHRHLAALGYRGTLLVPETPALSSLYAGMGYEMGTTFREFTCEPGEEPAPIFPVDAGEYARRRRALLPQGGIIQEGENLAFLATQASFYAGPGFLLAARGDGDTLYGLELLGDSSAAPGILRSLGFQAGTFRAPGHGKAFAMYRPLLPGIPPGYFAFSFG